MTYHVHVAPTRERESKKMNTTTRLPYRGTALVVTSAVENACTVETISFTINDEAFTVRGAYGNAQREAERIINGLSIAR